MKCKINIPMDEVVIGSNSVAEHKLQVINFLNLIHLIAFGGADRGNINPWFFNLKYEIRCLRKQAYQNADGSKIEVLIDTFKEKVVNKQASEEDWENVLNTLAETFEIEYTLNY